MFACCFYLSGVGVPMSPGFSSFLGLRPRIGFLSSMIRPFRPPGFMTPFSMLGYRSRLGFTPGRLSTIFPPSFLTRPSIGSYLPRSIIGSLPSYTYSAPLIRPLSLGISRYSPGVIPYSPISSILSVLPGRPSSLGSLYTSDIPLTRGIASSAGPLSPVSGFGTSISSPPRIYSPTASFPPFSVVGTGGSGPVTIDSGTASVRNAGPLLEPVGYYDRSGMYQSFDSSTAGLQTLGTGRNVDISVGTTDIGLNSLSTPSTSVPYSTLGPEASLETNIGMNRLSDMGIPGSTAGGSVASGQLYPYNRIDLGGLNSLNSVNSPANGVPFLDSRNSIASGGRVEVGGASTVPLISTAASQRGFPYINPPSSTVASGAPLDINYNRGGLNSGQYIAGVDTGSLNAGGVDVRNLNSMGMGDASYNRGGVTDTINSRGVADGSLNFQRDMNVGLNSGFSADAGLNAGRAIGVNINFRGDAPGGLNAGNFADGGLRNGQITGSLGAGQVVDGSLNAGGLNSVGMDSSGFGTAGVDMGGLNSRSIVGVASLDGQGFGTGNLHGRGLSNIDSLVAGNLNGRRFGNENLNAGGLNNIGNLNDRAGTLNGRRFGNENLNAGGLNTIGNLNERAGAFNGRRFGNENLNVGGLNNIGNLNARAGTFNGRRFGNENLNTGGLSNIGNLNGRAGNLNGRGFATDSVNAGTFAGNPGGFVAGSLNTGAVGASSNINNRGLANENVNAGAFASNMKSGTFVSGGANSGGFLAGNLDSTNVAAAGIRDVPHGTTNRLSDAALNSGVAGGLDGNLAGAYQAAGMNPVAGAAVGDPMVQDGMFPGSTNTGTAGIQRDSGFMDTATGTATASITGMDPAGPSMSVQGSEPTYIQDVNSLAAGASGTGVSGGVVDSGQSGQGLYDQGQVGGLSVDVQVGGAAGAALDSGSGFGTSIEPGVNFGPQGHYRNSGPLVQGGASVNTQLRPNIFGDLLPGESLIKGSSTGTV